MEKVSTRVACDSVDENDGEFFLVFHFDRELSFRIKSPIESLTEENVAALQIADDEPSKDFITRLLKRPGVEKIQAASRYSIALQIGKLWSNGDYLKSFERGVERAIKEYLQREE